MAVLTINVAEAASEHFARIHRAALILSGNPWDADDLAQETFLILARQGSQFAGRSNLYTWLYGILLNLDRSHRRRCGMKRRKLQVLWDDGSSDSRAAPAASVPVETADWNKSLWKHVNQLPEGQRHVLVLRFGEGLAYEEISEVLECPLGTVKSRIFHGLLGLRKMMQGEHESHESFPKKSIEKGSSDVG